MRSSCCAPMFFGGAEITDAAPSSSSPTRSTVPRLTPRVALDADDQVLLGRTVNYYHETPKKSPEALAYLAARGLVNPDPSTGSGQGLIDRFGLGYADRTPGLRLPEKTRKASANIGARLEQNGEGRAGSSQNMRPTPSGCAMRGHWRC